MCPEAFLESLLLLPAPWISLAKEIPSLKTFLSSTSVWSTYCQRRNLRGALKLPYCHVPHTTSEHLPLWWSISYFVNPHHCNFMMLLDPRLQSSSASQKSIQTCPSPTNECVPWLSCLITGLSSNIRLLLYQKQIAVHAVFFLFLLRALAEPPPSDGFKWPNCFLLLWFYLLTQVILL